MKQARAVLLGGVGLAAAWVLLRKREDTSGEAWSQRIFVLDGGEAPKPSPRPRDDACCSSCAAGDGAARNACCATGRNAGARSSWRAPGQGRPWAPWVYELSGRNGVYLIRPVGGGEVLYIGESHRGRLMKTLTRHLWQWNGQGSGPTYDPRQVEIAIELVDDPADAVARQFELIQKLEPRDNVQDGHSLSSPDDVPF